MHILYTCNTNLISELFNEHVSSLLRKNTDPTFIHAWSEKKHVISWCLQTETKS